MNSVQIWQHNHYKGRSGAYVLFVEILDEIKITLGRFKKGKVISFPSGYYCYIGSAMGQRSSSLPHRVLRHSRRSNGNHHQILKILYEKVKSIDPEIKLSHSKTPHWNIDWILEHPQVILSKIVLIQSNTNIEHELAETLENHPDTQIIESGIGANDYTGATHFLQITNGKPQGLLSHLRKTFDTDLVA